MTKLVFMGTPAFSATVLEGLLTDERYEIVAVVTQPDRAVGRKKEIRMTPVKEVALAHDLPIYQPEKLSGSEEMAQVMALGADGIVTAAYGQFLPSKLLNSMDAKIPWWGTYSLCHYQWGCRSRCDNYGNGQGDGRW